MTTTTASTTKSTTTTSTSKSGSQPASAISAPSFWPTWTPPTLSTAVPLLSPQYDYAAVADANGNSLAGGASVVYHWSLTNPAAPVVGYAKGLDVYAGQVVGVGAQAVDLGLSRGSTLITNLAGAFVRMQGQSSLTAATSLTANALSYGSFALLGGPETLTINQAKSSPATAPAGGPAIVVDASSEQPTSGIDTISINTATIASTSAATPDVFIHLGADAANVAVSGTGSAVVVAGAGALNLRDTNSGGTLLTFGSGATAAWGGSGHNVYAVLAAAPISSDIIYDFKGAKTAAAGSDPFALSGADTLEVSASLTATTSVSPSGGGTLVSFGPGHNLWLSGVTDFKTTDIKWLTGV